MRSRPLIVLLAAVALGGCGGEETLSAGSAEQLRSQVAAVREAAGEGDRAAALEALDGLEADVRDLAAGGSLAQADADALRRGIGRARRRVRAEIAEPTPAPTATADRHRHAGADRDARPGGAGRGRGGAPGRAGQGERQGQGQGQGQEGRRLMRPAEGVALADGRYTFVRHLGSGGMASVWLARDETLHRDVAIKLMADTLADDERWLARFQREARAAAALSHPHIVKVFDYGIEEHRPYLVMAHVPGGSLRDRLQDGGELPDAGALARELLSALAHVHAAGIVHRDVKPGNVLLDEHGSSQLTDFGIARPQDATEMTQTGMVLGTIRYLAPEVADGGPATERSDLYSAGCVLRELAGGDPPLRELLEALTDDDPERRPSSAEDALARLAEDVTAPDAARSRADGGHRRAGADGRGAASAEAGAEGGRGDPPARVRPRGGDRGHRAAGRDRGRAGERPRVGRASRARCGRVAGAGLGAARGAAPRPGPCDRRCCV